MRFVASLFAMRTVAALAWTAYPRVEWHPVTREVASCAPWVPLHASHVTLHTHRCAVRLQTGDEVSSLLAQFNLGLTRQRAGDADGALEAYSVFIAGAEDSGAPPYTFAEAHANVGIIQAQQRDHAAARASFERALSYRPLGSAHVNLALVCLAEGAAAAAEDGRSGSIPVDMVKEATEHCRAALALDDDPNSVATAERLLGDMMRRA